MYLNTEYELMRYACAMLGPQTWDPGIVAGVKGIGFTRWNPRSDTQWQQGRNEHRYCESAGECLCDVCLLLHCLGAFRLRVRSKDYKACAKQEIFD